MIGFLCPWSMLHIVSLIKSDYPVVSELLLVSLPFAGLIFLIVGLLGRNRRKSGIMKGMALGWRENVGFGALCLIGLALAVPFYELNLIKF